MKARKIAAGLMLLSGVTHVSQLLVYGSEVSVVGASVFGLIYFVIGLFLLGKSKGALWAGAIIPSVGGILGVYRFFYLQTNPFSVFHVAIDLIVVPLCVYLLWKKD